MTITQARAHIEQYDALLAEKISLESLLGTQSSAQFIVINSSGIGKSVSTTNATLISSVQTAISARITAIDDAIANIESLFT
jgi:hypothetical protein